MKIWLNDAAKLLRVHPRTILRAVQKEPNASWTPDFNPEMDESEILDAFNMKPKIWKRLKNNKDTLLTRQELLDFYDLTESTMKRRKYPAAARTIRLKRFSQIEVAYYHHLHFDKDDEDSLALSDIL